MVITGYVSNLLTGVRFRHTISSQDLKQWYVLSVVLKFSAAYTKKLPVRLFSLTLPVGVKVDW